MTTPLHEQEAIRALLANLTADPSDLKAQSRMGEVRSAGFKIEPQHLPEDMLFERAYMDVLWKIHETGSVPYPDTVLLLLSQRFKDPRQLQDQFNLVQTRATQGKPVKLLVKALGEGIAEQELMVGAAEFMQVMQQPVGSVSERFNKAMEKIKERQVGIVAQDPMRNIDRLHTFIETLRRRSRRAASGKAMGVAFPLYGLRELAPVLRPTDVTLLSGVTKSGKTTWATHFAEYNAWDCGTPILLLHRETSEDSLQERQLARHLLIPPWAMKTVNPDTGKLFADPDTEPWRTMLYEFEAAIEEHERENAPIIYQHCAGWPNWMMEQAVANFVEWCERNGFETHGVVVDYLQKMSPNGPDQRQTIANNSEAVKVWADTYQTHIALFSQDDINSQGAGKAGKQQKSFGSQEPMHKAQNVVVFRNEQTHGEVYVEKPDEDGLLQLQYNALGRPRVYSHPEKGWDRAVEIEIVLSNDDQPGSCYAWVEWPLNLIHDISKPRDYDEQ